MIPLVVVITIGILTIMFVIVGMARNDFQEIRTKQMMRRHPNARAMRSRPLVNIVISGTLTEASLKSIRTGRYKKHVVTQAAEVSNNALIYNLDGSSKLMPGSLLTAVQQLSINPKRKSVPITPLISFEESTVGIFRIYAKLASIPFTEARAGFGLTAIHTLSYATLHSRDHLVKRATLIATSLNFIVIMYACYAAAMLHQPEIILIYTCALGFWLTWCVIRYPYFSFIQKIGLLVLMPVSFSYFMYVALAAPIRLAVNYLIQRSITSRA